MRNLIVLASAAAATFVAGCSLVPASGPTIREIERTAGHESEIGIDIIEMTQPVAQHLARLGSSSLYGSFPSRARAPFQTIGPGDVLQISIWEPGGSGLFGASAPGPAGASSGGARAAALQPIVVEGDGFVSIPFAGRIAARGISADALRARIEARLKDKAITPQVMVTVVTNNYNRVTVGGEVLKAGVYPLSAQGDRLLDAVAAAGGSKFPDYETKIRVTRHSRDAAVSLRTILSEPNENIYIQPGDSIYLTRWQKTFTAVGAAGKVGHYPFEYDQLTLAEGIARAGGMIDAQSDLGGLFLFRYESGAVLAKFNPGRYYVPEYSYPVAYKIDWKKAAGYIFARQIRLRDKDMLVVANAEGTQLLKTLQLARGVSGIVSDIKGTTTKN